MQVKAKSIRSLYEDFSSKRELPTKEEIVVEGWVKTNRNSGKIGFIELHGRKSGGGILRRELYSRHS